MRKSGFRVARARRVTWDGDRRRWMICLTAVMTAILFFIAATLANAALAAAQDANGTVKIELNKLEQTDKGCRFFWLVNNQSSLDLKDLDVSFYWFQSDGVIGGDLRFAFAPAGSKSLKVKKYMLPNQTCSDFSSLLVNEINQCSAATGPVSECAKHLTYASRTKVEFLK